MPSDASNTTEFQVERYRFILQQIHAINENVYRFLAIYQALTVSLASAALALMIGYKKWGIDAGLARKGVVGLAALVTVVALFVIFLIVVGIASWIDYRREECTLSEKVVGPGFRAAPSLRNWYRWYETFVVLFVLTTTLSAWIGVLAFILPAMK
ncbi:hypothetical protein [Micromonospora rubida]|uniref:hypothetical protein n=1 Tax=Micromonospora rubida TaxID=2697657 RepID=UPI001378AFC7|nr:hypothetical protein [Micromonospora rubida]NBE80879.1 hypothetical protein [Micromonospora rubida]